MMDNAMIRVERRVLVERAEAFADYLGTNEGACVATREHLMRFAAFRDARMPFCLTGRFSSLRHAAEIAPVFDRLTQGWPEASINLFLALTAKTLWARARAKEREAVLAGAGLLA